MSLTVALLASFSGMQTAQAEVTDISMPETREQREAAGYKLFPGVGWVSPQDLPKEIQTVYRVNPETGERVLDLDAMIEKANESKTTNTVGIWIEKFISLFTLPFAHAGDGWNQVASKDDSSNDFSYIRAYWDVPAAPVDYDDGTNFSFPAIQPDAASIIIFQPVLQHGNSGICNAGDAFVTYALIYVHGVGYWNTPCEDADVDDRIRGTISESSNYWTIAMKNYDNSDANDSYQVYSSTTMEFGALAVETAYLSNDCDELQGDVEFETVTHTGDVDNFASGGVNTFCGQSVTIVSESNVEMFNNN